MKTERITKVTRFDVPDSVQNVIEVARMHDIIDSKDIIALGINFGSDWKAIVEEILEYAFAMSHVNDSHKHVCTAAEIFWKEVL